MVNKPPPAWILKALENQQDILSEELKKEQELFRRTSCPLCGTRDLVPVLDTKQPLREGDVLFRRLLVCTKCNTTTDPYTGLTVVGEKND